MYTEVLNKYRALNETAVKGGAVFFGADWLYGIPLAELVRDKEGVLPVYNRSIMGMTLSDAQKAVDTCICHLMPSKVFINIGENDIKAENFSASEFAVKYEWLLYLITTKCNCSLYIISVASDKSDSVNVHLKRIAEKHGCKYIDSNDCRTSFRKFSAKINYFLRNRSITFYEAMRI